MKWILASLVLAFSATGCYLDDSGFEECVRFDAFALRADDKEQKATLKALYEACYASDLDALLDVLPDDFRIYAEAFRSDWQLICLEIVYVSKSPDFMYCLYSSHERRGLIKFKSEGVLLWSKIEGNWVLMNFPFRSSEMPEFAGYPLMFSADR